MDWMRVTALVSTRTILMPGAVCSATARRTAAKSTLVK